jgi:hypothetical protein
MHPLLITKTFIVFDPLNNKILIKSCCKDSLNALRKYKKKPTLTHQNVKIINILSLSLLILNVF